MKRLRRWWRRHIDTTQEAQEALAEVAARTPEVTRLAAAINAERKRNCFSLSVQNAIARTREA